MYMYMGYYGIWSIVWVFKTNKQTKQNKTNKQTNLIDGVSSKICWFLCLLLVLCLNGE